MKGKSSSNIKKSNTAIEVDDSDESSSLSSLQSDDKSNGSDDEDDEDEDEYDVAQMTDREARQMFNDEVSFSPSSSSCCLQSEIICPSYPRLQTMMQLRCLTIITTSKSPIPILVAASGGPARKPRDPPHRNLKECSMMQAIQAKRRLTRTTTPLDMFLCLLKVLSSRSLTRWASYMSY